MNSHEVRNPEVKDFPEAKLAAMNAAAGPHIAITRPCCLLIPTFPLLPVPLLTLLLLLPLLLLLLLLPSPLVLSITAATANTAILLLLLQQQQEEQHRQQRQQQQQQQLLLLLLLLLLLEKPAVPSSGLPSGRCQFGECVSEFMRGRVLCVGGGGPLAFKTAKGDILEGTLSWRTPRFRMGCTWTCQLYQGFCLGVRFSTSETFL